MAGIGKGHSGPVTAVKFSPDEKRVVSVGAEGGIFIWKLEKKSSSSPSAVAAAT